MSTTVANASATTVERRNKKRVRIKKHFIGWAFISPWVIGFLVFTLFPFLASFVLSFTDYEIAKPIEYTGLYNFRHMFLEDRKFWISLQVSSYYALMVVPLSTILGILTALLLNQKVRGVPFFRTAFYIPSMVSGIGWLLLWTFLLQKEGAINWALAMIGIEGPAYLHSKTWALPALALMELFVVGSAMVITLAALQGVPQDLYDACAIDGGGEGAKFWNITIPQISPAIFYNLVISFIATLQTFSKGYIMTEGGPRDSTLFYALYLYRNGFLYNNMSYASALAWVLLIIILAITALNFLGGRYWVFYEAEERQG